MKFNKTIEKIDTAINFAQGLLTARKDDFRQASSQLVWSKAEIERIEAEIDEYKQAKKILKSEGEEQWVK